MPTADPRIGVSRFSQAILDSFAANIAVLNKDGVIVTVNKAWTLFATENPESRLQSAQVGVNYLNLVDEKWGPNDESEKAAATGIRKVILGTLPEFSLEYDFHGADGVRWFLLHIISLLEDSNEAAMITHYDITERKLAEIKREDNAEQFQELANHLHQVFWIKDAVDTHTLYVSPAFEQIWGRTCQSLYDDPNSFRESLHPDDRDKVPGSITDKNQSGGFDGEYRIFRPDGTMRWIWGRDYPVRDGDGNLKRLVGVAEDITERKQLEAQFIEAQKMEIVGQLAAGIAHDFNNVLGVIMGYSELIADGATPDNPFQNYAEEIRHAAQRASGLTKQLLIFSRKQTVEAVVLNINETVAGMDKMLLRLVDENVEMKTIYAKEEGCIKADSGYIWQVLMNLVVNARDAMPAGGKLTIVTSHETLDAQYAESHTGVTAGEYMMLSVSDTGTGMTPEVKARLFEAFYTTKALGKGTGLGLVTCQTIVRQAGGHIEVVSVVDRGTTFKIYFPKVSALPQAATPAMARTGPLPKTTETLLLVEDEPALRNLARGVLEARGYTVLTAPNGQDALSLVHDHQGEPIRLVVTDVVMPKMGGKLMAEWLRSTYPDLKVLFTSGYTDEVLNNGQFDQGVAFLPKPYTPAELVRKVRQLLNS